MKKKKRSFLSKPAFLLVLAVLLLALSALGSAQAALTYYSENYAAEVTVSSIGVSLLENGQKISYRDYQHQGDSWSEGTGKLLEHLLDEEEGGKVVPGKAYKEKLSVENSGDIDTYVRVILYKDWQDGNGSRDTTLSPALIKLGLAKGQGWEVDEDASTTERTILYYTKPLAPGESTAALTDTLQIDAGIAKKAKESISVNEEGYKTISTEYAYDGYRFNVTAEVDAVQTHNAQEAIKSAWGVDVDVAEDGTLGVR